MTGKLLLNWTLPVLVVAAWQVLGGAGIAPEYLSTPGDILAALWGITIDGELARALAASLYRVIVGYAIGAAVGTLAGLAAGITPAARNLLEPVVSLLFAVPKIAFFPVIVLLFGIGHASKIAIIAVSCFFPLFVAARAAVMTVNKHLLWAGRNMGAPPHVVFLRVVLPAALPHLFAGLRIGLAHAFVVLFAAELIGSNVGLGSLITDGENADQFDLMFAGILCFAILGFLGDRLLLALRARLLRGQLIGTEEQVRR
jgi:ABC-type nitrate/sulfonate/bicarbonate transport system permease component